MRTTASPRPDDAGVANGGDRLVARIDHEDAGGALLRTSVSGHLQALTTAGLRRAFWQHPMHSLGVIWRIHWQALGLWFKRVPLVRKPAPPADFATRADA
jgi:DUF1365 family protein